MDNLIPQLNPRYALPKGLEAVAKSPLKRETSSISIVNISQSGVCIGSPLEFSVGENIQVILSHNEVSYQINGKIKWSNKDEGSEHLYGIEVENRDVAVQCVKEILATVLTISRKDRRRSSATIDSQETKKQEHREKIIRVPHDARKNYDRSFVVERRKWLEDLTKSRLTNISSDCYESMELRGNIENFIGSAQIPIGIVGPLKIDGQYAKGTFYVPIATTEGGLISTYQRGAIAITKAGGAKTCVTKDENFLDPIFVLSNLGEANKFISWVSSSHQLLKRKVESVTNHGKLNGITPILIGRRVVLKISYFTEDAMGANMINFATDAICKFISENFPIQRYLLRSNYSSEKKVSGSNIVSNYGKEVYVESIIPKRIVKLHLNSSSEEIGSAWHSWALSSINSGMIGINAQIANGLSGLFIACGQDVAHVTNASVGINMLEKLENGDLYASLKLPNIIVGTVGGGTALNTQRECLEMIGCYGKGKAKKFSEIVAATLLAGEIGICAGITTDEFLAPHVRASVYTKEKAYDDNHLAESLSKKYKKEKPGRETVK